MKAGSDKSAAVDIAIVGAGAAGIGAGLAARAAGLSCVLLEASARIGGRAFTEPSALGAPWDAGCFILHSASENPLARVAERLGLPVQKGLIRRARLLRGGVVLPESAAEALLAHYEDCWRAVQAAARDGRDVAVSEVVDGAHDLGPQFAHRCGVFQGVDPEDASTLDYARYRDLRENWPVIAGYGALIARIADGLPVRLNAPVTAIDHGRRPLRLTTPDGVVRAAACIVTASTGVLAAEAIRFDPPLSAARRQAIDDVPMGQAEKVAFAFPPGALDAEPNDYLHVHTGTRRTMGFHLRPFGYDYASAYAGGSTAAALADCDDAEAYGFALDTLSQVFGTAIASKVIARRRTRWRREPWIRGAYSAARPGRALSRLVLAEPLSERVEFAGEAVSPEFFSTAHGAYLSGVAAVTRIARALGRDADAPPDPVAIALGGGSGVASTVVGGTPP